MVWYGRTLPASRIHQRTAPTTAGTELPEIACHPYWLGQSIWQRGFHSRYCYLTGILCRIYSSAPGSKLRPYGAIQICLLLLLFFKSRYEFPRLETKINTRNYNSNGQSSELFSSAKLSCSRVALKRALDIIITTIIIMWHNCSGIFPFPMSLHEWMRTQMPATPSSNLLLPENWRRPPGRPRTTWTKTFMMTSLRWILGYTRLEIWRKIGLCADWYLCTALRTRSGACMLLLDVLNMGVYCPTDSAGVPRESTIEK